jgi:hypothetical protein
MSLITHAAEFIPEDNNVVTADQSTGGSKISRVMNRIANRKSTPKRPPSDSDAYVSEPMTNISPIGDADDKELGNFTAPVDSSMKIQLPESGRVGTTYANIGNGGFRHSASSGFSGELDDAYGSDMGVSSDTTTNAPPPASMMHSGDTIKKLDYLIHMIEEQRDHKTGRVAEELVLYSFLGVFVIFTIDSFVKVGKYTR